MEAPSNGRRGMHEHVVVRVQAPKRPPPPLSFNVPKNHIAAGGDSTHHCHSAPTPGVPTPPPAAFILLVCYPHPCRSGAGRAGGDATPC